MRSLAILRALARFYLRSIPRDWFRRAPYLPVPSGRYVRWRLETAYGYRRPNAGDVVGDLWQFGSWLVLWEREAARSRTGASGRAEHEKGPPGAGGPALGSGDSSGQGR